MSNIVLIDDEIVGAPCQARETCQARQDVITSIVPVSDESDDLLLNEIQKAILKDIISSNTTFRSQYGTFESALRTELEAQLLGRTFRRR